MRGMRREGVKGGVGAGDVTAPRQRKQLELAQLKARQTSLRSRSRTVKELAISTLRKILRDWVLDAPFRTRHSPTASTPRWQFSRRQGGRQSYQVCMRIKFVNCEREPCRR